MLAKNHSRKPHGAACSTSKRIANTPASYRRRLGRRPGRVGSRSTGTLPMGGGSEAMLSTNEESAGRHRTDQRRRGGGRDGEEGRRRRRIRVRVVRGAETPGRGA